MEALFVIFLKNSRLLGGNWQILKFFVVRQPIATENPTPRTGWGLTVILLSVDRLSYV